MRRILLGLIGSGIQRSLTPALQEAEAAAHDIHWSAGNDRTSRNRWRRMGSLEQYPSWPRPPYCLYERLSARIYILLTNVQARRMRRLFPALEWNCQGARRDTMRASGNRGDFHQGSGRLASIGRNRFSGCGGTTVRTNVGTFVQLETGSCCAPTSRCRPSSSRG